MWDNLPVGFMQYLSGFLQPQTGVDAQRGFYRNYGEIPGLSPGFTDRNDWAEARRFDQAKTPDYPSGLPQDVITYMQTMPSMPDSGRATYGGWPAYAGSDQENMARFGPQGDAGFEDLLRRALAGQLSRTGQSL